MRIALDTNILVYAEGVPRTDEDMPKIAAARRLTHRLAELGTETVIAVQSLAELHHVLVRRARLTSANASDQVRTWCERADLVGSSPEILRDALSIAAIHGLQIFDAIILAAAHMRQCDFLLSEDLQHGFLWRGVTVANPFAADPHPAIRSLVASPGRRRSVNL